MKLRPERTMPLMALMNASLMKFLIIIIIIASLDLSPISARVHLIEKFKISRSQDINDDPDVNINNENTLPIIGVLTQEVSRLILRKYPDNNFTSYIAASYVKFVEGAGGRVVPIWIGKSRDYYEDIMTKINGVLLPGGATWFNQTNGYADAGRHLYEIAIEMNERGIYMPIWGTCLGFELMVYLSANETDPRTSCESSSQPLPLQFKQGFRSSRLFKNASDEIINIMQNYPVTANFHMYCFTQETFSKMQLNEIWSVLSTNYDWNDSQFISSIEHVKYPFYGVQFHPEKNIYEFIPNRNITHTSFAIRSSQYFADFFINQARLNMQKFDNKTEEANSLIYNWKPEYTGNVGSAFVQQYLFENRSNDAVTFLKHLNAIFILSWSILFLVAMQHYFHY